MADFPNSTPALEILPQGNLPDIKHDRSSSERPGRLANRRGVLSMASVLAGCAAAAAMIPFASKTTLPSGANARALQVKVATAFAADADLVVLCTEWHDRRRRLRRLEKEGDRVYLEARSKMPEKPRELFEPIDTGRSLFNRWVEPKIPGDPFPTADGSWQRKRLEFYAEERPDIPNLRPAQPSPECRAHCRKLIALSDEHEAIRKRIFAEHDRLDRIWDRENAENWRLFMRIIGARAETIQGVAAQLKVIDKEGALDGYHSEAVNERVIGITRNIRRLAGA